MVVIDRQLDGAPAPTAAVLLLRLQPAIDMTREQFFRFCQLNAELRIERTADGDIAVVPPRRWRDERAQPAAERAGGALGRCGWYRGVAFDSSVGFELPSGAVRSPDAAWVRRARLTALSAEQKQGFLPLCPDFVIELRSPSDSVAAVQRKMEEYRANGARLGWLIVPDHRRVAVFHAGGEVEWLDQPASISADPVLRKFVLNLAEIWESTL